MLWSALSLTLGYNATLVTLGATLLGIATGIAGTFLYLRKNALISDAISHATLPGLGAAFLIMTATGLDARNLIGLLMGSAVSAGLGLVIVNLLTAKTRLSMDAAIGSVLSVFFAFGVVLLSDTSRPCWAASRIGNFPFGFHRWHAFQRCGYNFGAWSYHHLTIGSV